MANNIIRILKSLIAGNRPPNTNPYGAAYANFADRAFGVMDNSAPPVPVDFIAPWMGRGSVNRIINGSFSVFQRGSGTLNVPTSGAFVADRWFIIPTGGAVTANQYFPGSGATRSSSLFVYGGTGVTSLIFRYRIAAANANDLSGRQLTLQFKVSQSTAAAIAPVIALYSPTAKDNFSALTTLASNTLQSCPPGIWTTCAWTSPAAGFNTLNGIEIDINFTGGFGSTSQYMQLADADLRFTQNLPAGLNASPPLIEMRLVSRELADCQRYFFQATGAQAGVPYGVGFCDSAVLALIGVKLPVTMRAPPTVAFSAASTFALRIAGGATVALSAIGSGTPSLDFVQINASVASGLTVGYGAQLRDGGAANSFMQFSAEL
jgi:hypothetical protein